MTLEQSVLLLALALAGAYALPRLLPQKPRLRRGLQAPVHRDGSAQRSVYPADAAVRLGSRTETLKIGRKRP